MVFRLKINEKKRMFYETSERNLKNDYNWYYWQLNGRRKAGRFHLRQQRTVLFARQSRKALDLNACEQGIFARPMHLDDREDEYNRSSRVLRSRSRRRRKKPARIVIFSHECHDPVRC